jgi:hypothetical protein
MDELEKLVAHLMSAVRNMPPGQRRQESLKEIGRLRSRMDTLLSANSAQSLAKDQRSAVGKLTKPTKAAKNKPATVKKNRPRPRVSSLVIPGS